MENTHGKNQLEVITLKDIILTFQDFVRYLWTKALWICLASILGLGIGFLLSYNLPTLFHAEMSFMVNEDDGASLGGAGAILGQFGLGGSVASEYNLDKIVELSRSRKIIQQTLMDSCMVDGRVDLLANHLIRVYGYHDEWAEHPDERLRDFIYTHGDVDNFEITENKVLKILHRRLIGTPQDKDSGLMNCTYTEATGILDLQLNTLSEELSAEMARSIYRHLSSFYISKSTEKHKSTLLKLESKVDSIEYELRSAEYRMADYQDKSLGVIGQKKQLARGRAARDIQVLTIMYGEALKNRETSRFLMSNSTPFFQVIDDVLEPLPAVAPSIKKSLMLSGIIGGIMASLLLVAIKIYRDTMSG